VTRRSVDLLIAYLYAATCFLVVIAPALAVRWTTATLDVAPAGLDLVAASAVLGGGHAVIAWVRLRSEERTAVRRLDMWIAALNSLVVLALGATVLLVAVLLPFATEHAYMANQGYPVVALWAAVQLLAIVLAEAVGRVVFWWLEPHPAPHLHCRWSVMPSWRRAGRAGRVREPESAGLP
jgi:hypothetical protein